MRLVANQFYSGPVAGSHPPQSQPYVAQDNPNFPGGTGSFAARSFGTSVAALIPLDSVSRPFKIFGWSVALTMGVDSGVSPSVQPAPYGTLGKLYAGVQPAEIVPPTSQGQDPLVLPRDMSTMLLIWDGANDATPPGSGVKGATAAPYLASYQLPAPIPVEDANREYTFVLMLTPSLSNCGITIWTANYSVQIDEGGG